MLIFLENNRANVLMLKLFMLDIDSSNHFVQQQQQLVSVATLAPSSAYNIDTVLQRHKM